MFALMIVEVGFRMIVGTIHPLTEEFYLRTPPGKLGNLPLLLVSAIMLYLWVRRPGAEPADVQSRSPIAG